MELSSGVAMVAVVAVTLEINFLFSADHCVRTVGVVVEVVLRTLR